MQRYWRVVCLAYGVVLTLLLVTDVSQWFGANGNGLRWIRMIYPIAHLLSFFLLAVLALAARWPVPRWVLAPLLALYGAATEIVQVFVPRRTPDWADWIQDVSGIVLGVAFCWGVAMLYGAMTRRRRGRESARPRPSEEPAVLPSLLQRCAAGATSWWR